MKILGGFIINLCHFSPIILVKYSDADTAPFVTNYMLQIPIYLH